MKVNLVQSFIAFKNCCLQKMLSSKAMLFTIFNQLSIADSKYKYAVFAPSFIVFRGHVFATFTMLSTANSKEKYIFRSTESTHQCHHPNIYLCINAIGQ